ncbi:hypothetical protein EUTSA_v10015673mg, partial [Eutrema salsugineum]
IIVPPGRYVSVDPGQGRVLRITYIGFSSEVTNPEGEAYLGINSSKEEFLIGRIPQLKTRVNLTEEFTLGHSGYSPVVFRGYYLSRRRTLLPEPRPQTDLALRDAQASNSLSWPLGIDNTSKVFSYLRGTNVHRLECICKIFYTAGTYPESYSNIDLSHVEMAEDLDALVMMRRCHGRLRSLVLGSGPTIQFTHRSLEPLQTIGKHLRRLHLHGLHKVHEEHLREALPCCSVLTELELNDLGSYRVDFVLEIVGSSCPLLELLIYTGAEDSISTRENTVSEPNLHRFLQNCTRVEVLGLHSVNVDDNQLVKILQHLGRLRSLLLSKSMGFSGVFFVGEGVSNGNLQVLHLEACIDLSEDCLGDFIQQLKQTLFENMEELFLTGRPGFEERIGLTDLIDTRPNLAIRTRPLHTDEDDDDDELQRLALERAKSLVRDADCLHEETSEDEDVQEDGQVEWQVEGQIEIIRIPRRDPEEVESEEEEPPEDLHDEEDYVGDEDYGNLRYDPSRLSHGPYRRRKRFIQW